MGTENQTVELNISTQSNTLTLEQRNRVLALLNEMDEQDSSHGSQSGAQPNSEGTYHIDEKGQIVRPASHIDERGQIVRPASGS